MYFSLGIIYGNISLLVISSTKPQASDTLAIGSPQIASVLLMYLYILHFGVGDFHDFSLIKFGENELMQGRTLIS